MGILLLILLILLVFGGLPVFNYHEMGWGPSGIGSVLLLIVIILLVTGRL